MEFNGLPSALPEFLRDLAANNERDWFSAHKREYQENVQAPLRDLVQALVPAMREIDPQFDVNPKGPAVSRIYRDTRFSRDKAPYRINQWICFKHSGEGWEGRPAYFLEIGPAGYRFGMGCYAAPPAAMRDLRAVIAARPERFADVLEAALSAGFAVEGDSYRRSPAPEGLPEPVQDWMGRKSPYLSRNRPLEPLLFSPALVEELQARWAVTAPLYQFLA